MASGPVGTVDVDAGHPAVFKDSNPAAAPDARYKAVFRSANPRGMLVFKSPDGLHWTPLAGAPVLTDGAFDSQNLAFWDPNRGEYRAYWHYFSGNNESTGGLNPAGVRAIRTASSKDLVHWGPSENLRYVDSPPEQLYTNTVAPDEISLYATEWYWAGRPGTVLRRYALRLDGFVSAHPPLAGGELVTRPVVFAGTRLEINLSTSAAGSVQAELQDGDGRPIPGFTLADSPPYSGTARGAPCAGARPTWESSPAGPSGCGL